MKTNLPCSDDQLRILLQSDSDEGGAEFRSVATHVDCCETCQARLGELAAEVGEWAEAHEMLVAVSEIRQKRDSQPRTGTWNSQRWQRRPTAWTESMARQILNPPSHPEMLGRIGRYEVERLIGAGGMGVVFKAFDTELNRPVAIKVLAPFLAGSGAARQRFAREARAAAAVVHEHVVAIHNVETEGESPFLVMPFVAGDSLQTRLDREGALDVCEVLRIGMQTAAGLAAAHAQGLVHRDVKPSNILLEEGVERSLLTDLDLPEPMTTPVLLTLAITPARLNTCRPSRLGVTPSTLAATCSVSAASFTQCVPAGRRFVRKPVTEFCDESPIPNRGPCARSTRTFPSGWNASFRSYWPSRRLIAFRRPARLQNFSKNASLMSSSQRPSNCRPSVDGLYCPTPELCQSLATS